MKNFTLLLGILISIQSFGQKSKLIINNYSDYEYQVKLMINGISSYYPFVMTAYDLNPTPSWVIVKPNDTKKLDMLKMVNFLNGI